MAVAESPVSEKTTRSTQANLGISGLLGGALLLLGLWFVFAGFPYIWFEFVNPRFFTEASGRVNEFLSGAMLLIVSLLLIAALGIVGYRQLRRVEFPGLRAGVVVGAVVLFLAASLIVWIGNKLGGTDVHPSTARMAIAVVAGLAVLAGVVWLFTRDGFQRWLVRHEANGWYSGTSFKGNQGMRVRRWTIIGVLTIGLSGVYVMVTHGILGTDRKEPVPGTSQIKTISNDWYWRIPFTTTSADDESQANAPTPEADVEARSRHGYRYIPLMYKVHLFLPLVLAGLLVWFAWRLVNQPTFGDFLIATEAEMNKVSWTTRKRLFQDTIVVLVTVFLMTMFLFGMDLLWIWSLSATGVLQKDPRAEQAKQMQKSKW